MVEVMKLVERLGMAVGTHQSTMKADMEWALQTYPVNRFLDEGGQGYQWALMAEAIFKGLSDAFGHTKGCLVGPYPDSIAGQQPRLLTVYGVAYRLAFHMSFFGDPEKTADFGKEPVDVHTRDYRTNLNKQIIDSLRALPDHLNYYEDKEKQIIDKVCEDLERFFGEIMALRNRKGC